MCSSDLAGDELGNPHRLDVAEEAQRHVQALHAHPAHRVAAGARPQLPRHLRRGRAGTLTELDCKKCTNFLTPLGCASLRGLRPCTIALTVPVSSHRLVFS